MLDHREAGLKSDLAECHRSVTKSAHTCDDARVFRDTSSFIVGVASWRLPGIHDMRILQLTFLHEQDFLRICDDAATPPVDVREWLHVLDAANFAYDPRELLAPVPEQRGLLEMEWQSPSSGVRYGILFVDMGHVADAIAYWRGPPLYQDDSVPLPHGYSRNHAMQLARARMEVMR